MKRKTGAILAGGMVIALMLTGCGRADSGMEELPPDGAEEEAKEETDSGESVPEAAGEDEAAGNAEDAEEDIFAGIEIARNGAGVAVHDPSIKVFDGEYYIYGSHMTGARSDDMQSWRYIGNNYSSSNPLFENLFAEGLGVFDYAGTYEDGSHSVWAEDVIYNPAMEKYVMYFCTSSTYIKSKLCYAVADQPEGPYVYQGDLLYSGFTAQDMNETDVCEYVDEETASATYLTGGQYNNKLWPNCIDPAPFYDADGRLWMTYGSWSGGIFLLELDEETGLVIHPETDEENEVDAYFGKRLLGGGHNSIEGPYIQYDESSGYYYLYVSYGGLERTGGYQIRVFRSEKPDGEYVDMNGAKPSIGYDHSKFGLKLSGNYYMPSNQYAYMATGGQSAFQDTDGKQYVCYHSRFDHGDESHEPCVKQVFLNEEGWPVLAPYTTKGETISENGYGSEEVAGTYYFINQGKRINDSISVAEKIELNLDGTVDGAITGTWEAKAGTHYMTLVYDDTVYSGVFCQMQDEAGQDVMTFSAVGENESIWGAKYFSVP